jgi:predicted hotdog family 3-hydroxylacyl-ACP dehydratase
MSAAFPPIAQLLPHRGPAILVDRLLALDAEGCRVAAQVRPGARYLDAQGELPAWVGLELMAQACSAFSGWRNTLSGRPIRVGYLLGTRSFDATEPAFPVGTELEVEVKVIFLDETGPSAFRCELRREGIRVAHATLKAIEVP